MSKLVIDEAVVNKALEAIKAMSYYTPGGIYDAAKNAENNLRLALGHPLRFHSRKFTSWYVVHQEEWNRKGGFMVARLGPYVISDYGREIPETDHLENATLMAASRDLLIALEQILAGYDIRAEDKEILEKLISKAKGEQR